MHDYAITCDGRSSSEERRHDERPQADWQPAGVGCGGCYCPPPRRGGGGQTLGLALALGLSDFHLRDAVGAVTDRRFVGAITAPVLPDHGGGCGTLVLCDGANAVSEDDTLGGGHLGERGDECFVPLSLAPSG